MYRKKCEPNAILHRPFGTIMPVLKGPADREYQGPGLKNRLAYRPFLTREVCCIGVISAKPWLSLCRCFRSPWYVASEVL
jgi:hypothetical protein